MKVPRLLFPVLLTSLGLPLASAPAQDSPLAKPLRRFDQNKDGKLTGEELVKARQAHNRGGRELEMNPRRWKEMMERRKQNWMRQQNQQLDLDGDGNLDAEEKSRAETIWKEIEAGLEKIQADILLKYDKNDDGDLTQDERGPSRRESERLRTRLEESVMAKYPAPPKGDSAPAKEDSPAGGNDASKKPENKENTASP